MGKKTLGRYEIQSELGRGSMGVVYRAHDPNLNRAVALKTILIPESLSEVERQTFLDRFRRESRAAARLIHPNVVIIHDASMDEGTGTPFIAMELVDGEPLDLYLETRGRLPWREALELVLPLCEALGEAHDQGIVHRDIKPANVMMTRRGIPKIADFGIAKMSAANLTQTGTIVGTPNFMSPEQLRGDPVDGRSDLFSLGALAYNLVTGERPFQGDEMATIATQVLYKNPRPPSEICADIPPALDAVVAWAMAKTPEARYESAKKFAEDLGALLEGREPRGVPSTVARTELDATSVVVPSGASSHSLPTLETSAPLVEPHKRSTRAPLFLALVLLLGGGTYYYRDGLAEHGITIESTRAAASELAGTVREKLEGLFQTPPSSEGEVESAAPATAERSERSLLIEITVKHHHRFGSCTGQLVLDERGMEYQSSEHGTWRWDFAQIIAIRRKSESAISVETNDDGMMGIVRNKKYNFSILEDLPEDGAWKRYYELFQNHGSRASS